MSDLNPLIEKAADVLGVHRWKSMGVSSVSCECGEILYGDDSLTQFPADEAFRQHLARAVLEAVADDLTRQAVAEALGPIRELAESTQAEEWRQEASRGTVQLPYASNRYVRLLDELRDAIRAAEGGAQ